MTTVPPMPSLSLAHDRYYDFDEMTLHLRALAERYPHLMKLEGLGRSHQGREVWLVTIHNPDTGIDLDKPAYYIDAQIHAEEHATSSVALYAADYLLERYGHDPQVTRLVDTMTFYIFPRLNPDGAEICLKTPHRWCGNGRYGPGADEVTHGLYQWDVNGDGHILQMRRRDPNGEWKISARDPRVLIQRGPDEYGGEYYRLYPEGLIPDFDGVEPDLEPPRDGNLNRNFPANWSPDEYGAGEYPGSEPESRALIDFILGHPNICGMNAFHTHGGVILRPSSTRYDAQMSPADINLFMDLGKVGTALTGYPVISIYEEFTPDKSKARHGSLTDWAYEQMGIPIFATELWDIERAAGMTKTAWYGIRPRDEEEQIQLLSWIDLNVGEAGYRPWESFDHPQLGQVEIGGVVDVWTFRNPPGNLLEDICHRNTLFCLAHASVSPKLELRQVSVVPEAEGLYRVRCVVGNTGYLPTNLTQVAIDKKVAVPVNVRLDTSAGQVFGPAQQDLGHLAGRNGRKAPWSPWGPQWQRTSRGAEWVVQAPAGTALTLTAQSDKAGTVVQTITTP